MDIGFLAHVIALRCRRGLNGWGAIPGGAISGGAMRRVLWRGGLPLLLSLRRITLGRGWCVARLLLPAVWGLRTVLAGGRRRLLAVWCVGRRRLPVRRVLRRLLAVRSALRRRLTVWSPLRRRLAVWGALGRRLTVRSVLRRLLTVLGIWGILLVLVLAWLSAGRGRLVLAAGLRAHGCGLVAIVRLLV